MEMGLIFDSETMEMLKQEYKSRKLVRKQLEEQLASARRTWKAESGNKSSTLSSRSAVSPRIILKSTSHSESTLSSDIIVSSTLSPTLSSAIGPVMGPAVGSSSTSKESSLTLGTTRKVKSRLEQVDSRSLDKIQKTKESFYYGYYRNQQGYNAI